MDYEQISKEIRKKVLKMFFESQTSHLGSSLSEVDILTILYFKILSLDPKNPWLENRDRFILSKGHGVAALYATLSQRGFFPKEILDNYCKDGSKLPGHSTKKQRSWNRSFYWFLGSWSFYGNRIGFGC